MKDKKNIQTPLYMQVVKSIEDQIVAGVYQKGDLLPSEKELMDSMGVSRITVRKALSILSESGFIETSQGRGSTLILDVNDMASHEKYAEDLKEYRRIFMECTQIRLLMEPEIARQAALKATKEQVKALRDCLNVTDDRRTDFHLTMVSILGNRELEEIMKKLIMTEDSKAPKGAAIPERQETTSRIMQAQHRRIFEAIERGDSEFAYFYMKEHTQFIKDIYEDYFENAGQAR